MHRLIIISFLILILFSCHTQNLYCLEPLPVPSPQCLTSEIIPVMISDPSAGMLSPVDGDRGISSSLMYINSISTLRTYGLNAITGSKSFAAITGASYLDAEDYSAQNYTVGGRLDYPFFRLGATYNLAFDRAEGYGGDSQSWFRAGMRLGTRDYSLGVVAENLYPTHREAAEIIPDYNINLCWKIDRFVTSGCGVLLYPHRDAIWQFGTGTSFGNVLQVMVTWQNEPSSFGYCAIIDIEGIRLSYAVKSHPELDWSQSVGLSITLP